jgi:exportin-T
VLTAFLQPRKVVILNHSTNELKFFCLQVLESLLRSERYNSLDAGSKQQIKSSVWEWLLQNLASPLPFYISQKLYLLIVLLFQHHFPREWPQFFDNLFGLLPPDILDSANFSPALDMFLEICITIDQETICTYIQRDVKDTERNAAIKDAMRESAVPTLIGTWQKLLISRHRTDSITSQKCLKLLSLYVSWVDINLVVTTEFMTVLYECFTNTDLCISACECASEIVLKGMPKLDKLNLLQMMNIYQVLAGLHHSQDEDFDEAVAKLINNIGLELCFCYTDGKCDIEKQRSLQALEQIYPFLIDFLSNEYDDTTAALSPFLSSYLLILKKVKRSNIASISTDKLLSLLRVLIQKSKYDVTETYHFGPKAGEDEALFIELRKSIKIHLEAVATIDEETYTNFISTLVCQSFDNIRQGSANMHWSNAELPLYLLYIFTEAKTTVNKAFVENNQKPFSKNAPPLYVAADGQYTHLGLMLSKMMESGIIIVT